MMAEALQGRTVLITGASSGIGEATAKAFAAEKVRLLLCARRIDRLEAMRAELLKLGAEEVFCFPMDVTVRESVKHTLESLPAEWRSVDILVNNAGLSRGLSKLYEDDIDNWDEMIDTNVKGLLYVSRAVIPGMVERGAGHVVNLGSIAGHQTYPNGAVYCASKAAERAISQGMKIDLTGTPVRVTSIDPGMVETEFSEVRFRGDKERAAKVYASVTPLRAEDVAETIVWVTTRPLHVNVAEMVLLPVDQANAYVLNRKA